MEFLEEIRGSSRRLSSIKGKYWASFCASFQGHLVRVSWCALESLKNQRAVVLGSEKFTGSRGDMH